MTKEKELKADLANVQAERDKANAEIAKLKRLLTKPKKENYKNAEIETIKSAKPPLDLEKAKQLGKKLNRSPMSIISKAKDLGIDYKAAPRKVSSERLVNKTKLTNQVLEAIGMPKVKRDYFSRKELLEINERLTK